MSSLSELVGLLLSMHKGGGAAAENAQKGVGLLLSMHKRGWGCC